MPAFNTTTELFDYFRRNARKLNCNPCFDDKQTEIREMNEKGSNGLPACLCKANTVCPCQGAVTEIERDGACYCEIFIKK
jgi:hypothetical protein